MNRLIIAGSPRVDGRTGHLAHDLFETCIDECPEDELAWVPVSEVTVQGCQGCGYCQTWADQLLSGEITLDEGDESNVEGVPARCALDDDMLDVYELIDDAEELTIVSPVYFAGPPSQLKALLDRLQPYYCLNIANGAGQDATRRPAILHVVGEGGDPHGYEPLVTIVKSALACAGFQLETVYDWVGKIDAQGEIQEEAQVIDLTQPVAQVQPEDVPPAAADDFAAFQAGEDERPQLRFDDQQVKQRGRQSAEQGRRPGKDGRTEKRQGKGNAQTNNRNKRKENQNRHASDGRNTGPKTQGSRRQAQGQGKGQGKGQGRSSGKGGNRRG